MLVIEMHSSWLAINSVVGCPNGCKYCLLQLINLARVLNVDMYGIKEYKDYKYDDINGLTILLGQLTEVVMENYGCRFKKSRANFNSSYDFIKDRLYKLFIITYQISKKYKLNMFKEFGEMLKDANEFLDRFRKDDIFL